MISRTIKCFFVIMLINVPAWTLEDAPAWLRRAASIEIPDSEENPPAFVVVDEENVKVESNGRVTTSKIYAVRILAGQGRSTAVARVIYRTDGGRVRRLRAWLIRSSGTPIEYEDDETIDLSLVGNDVYNEARVKVIDASNDADAGMIFGYESTTEDRSIFTQLERQFQSRLPTLTSRLTLTLPRDWRAEAVTFNHDPIEPSVAGSIYTWELQNLPYVEAEPSSPPLTSLVPRLAVSFFPSSRDQNRVGPAFTDWRSVSQWMSQLNDPQAVPDEAITKKVQELIVGAETELERIQEIASFVQEVQYISIQTGVGRGGGYRPHAASEVFANLYGDCKDKVNLMRAMLKTVEIMSYPVGIYSGDPAYVREQWPSPQQFNHAIIAIEVGSETTSGTIVNHAQLGRLLVFDATDPYTPLGYLPDHEQDSLALLVAGDEGGLIQMPVVPPVLNQLKRRTEVTLASDGSITASIQERAEGQAAFDSRRSFRQLSRAEYVGMIERWIARGVTGADVSGVGTDDSTASRFGLNVRFTAPRYGQLMNNRLLVLKPAIISRRESLVLTETSRKYPVVLDPLAYTDVIRIKLPAGFDVDELPEPVILDESFGSYSAIYEVEEGHLVLTRIHTQHGGPIPVEQYPVVRNFFEDILAAEQVPAVLLKK